MLEDLEPTSIQKGQKIDQRDILSEPITGLDNEDGHIYNIVVAECLRGSVFNDVGDIVNLCLKYKHGHMPSSYQNIATDVPLCFKKVRGRVVATSRKFPGFYKFSGYKQVNLMCPDIVMTKTQMR